MASKAVELELKLTYDGIQHYSTLILLGEFHAPYLIIITLKEWGMS